MEGRSRVSDVIKTVTQSRWSHAALYIGRIHEIENPHDRQRLKSFFDGQPDVQLIVESELGMGTVARPLSVYDRDHVRICRPKDITYRDAQKVIQHAISRLGTDYDIRQIFDLLRFFFPYLILPRRWRSSLFSTHPGKTTKTVCSTMIAEAFGSIQYPILPMIKRSEEGHVNIYRRNPKLCTPSDFDYSPYFDIIKYPFTNFAESEPHYRKLPWLSEEKLTKDESTKDQ
ncbi:hypothetical protein A3744_22875 [Oleiphilus sp. HI0073]|nr:hypothetical protein A3744_22875 [Oleiphilus sp. HI0073]